jgi:hypothetical protein
VKDRRLELLGCEANFRHEVWGSTVINSSRESLPDFFMGTETHILNRGTKLTFLDSKSNRYYYLYTGCDESGERLEGFT